MANEENKQEEGEELPTPDQIQYYLDSLDRIFKESGKFSVILGNVIGAGEEMKPLYGEGGLKNLIAFKAAVDAFRPSLQNLAVEIQENALEIENAQD